MELRRHLRTVDLVVLGVAGAVGTGVLFSSAKMAAVAGPALVLGWILGGVFYAFIAMTYVELSVLYPEAGGPSRYSLYTHGKATNLINAISDLIWYLFIPPIEALAAAEGINYFYPHLVNSQGNPTTLGAVIGTILMILFFPFNYFGIRAFSRSTNLFGTIKMALYLLVALGFLAFARFGNFGNYGGFVPLGGTGIFTAIPLAMFAYGGIRVIPDYAEEVHSPGDLRRSIILTVLGQTALYVLFAVAFLASLNWTSLSLKVGSWADVTKIAGNPFLVIAQHGGAAWLIAITAIIAIVGPFVTGYIYQGAGTRVLFAMGRTGFISTRLKQLDQRHATPVVALVVMTVVGVIVAYIAAPLPSIYGLISDAVVAGYLGFAVNPVAMLARRRDRNPEASPVNGGTVIATLAFIAASLITYWSGWPSVPYAVILLAIATVVFGLLSRTTETWANAAWYIVYILFITGMTYIGSVGDRTTVSFVLGSVIVAVVSAVVFLPWGVASRLSAVAPSSFAEPELGTGTAH
ncbi:MAG TPA: APC family permease [Thermomicrobiaceae bacterium]|nr:APC family permease [Thermomicrobiaceae bacterium]